MQAHRAVDIPEDLIDAVQFEIPEAPHDSVEHYLRRSITEFCEKSHFWQEDIGPIRVVDNLEEYELSVPRRVSIVTVHQVFYTEHGKVIELPRAAGDMSIRYWQPTPFTFVPEPKERLTGKDLSVIISLRPELYNGSFKVSQFLIQEYREALAAGAKASLYSVPRKPWTDFQLSQLNLSIFSRAAEAALRSQGRGYSRLPDRSVRKPRSFF